MVLPLGGRLGVRGRKIVPPGRGAKTLREISLVMESLPRALLQLPLSARQRLRSGIFNFWSSGEPTHSRLPLGDVDWTKGAGVAKRISAADLSTAQFNHPSAFKKASHRKDS
jgi:hypothetical protein